MVGSKGLFFFSESDHVAYQIKVEALYTYMQGNTLNLHTPLTPGAGFNGQLLKLCRCKYTYSLNKALKHTKKAVVMILMIPKVNFRLR